MEGKGSQKPEHSGTGHSDIFSWARSFATKQLLTGENKNMRGDPIPQKICLCNLEAQNAETKWPGLETKGQ